MSSLAIHHNLPEYTQSGMSTTRTGIFPPPRNQYLAKWDILFDKRIAEWISFKPQLGLKVYPCYACRDMFGSKNSFLDHVNRRGILLKYKCSFCMQADVLIFYNPCSFLLHTRQHYTLLGGQINLENLEVGLLPFGLGGFLPDPNIPLLYHVEDDNIGETSFINTRFYSPMNESKGHPVVNLLPNELLFFFSPEPSVPSTSLVLKQVSSNIPRCQFVILDNTRFTPIPNGLDINGKELQPAGTDTNTLTINGVHIKEEPEETSQSNFQYNIPIITKIETLDESNEFCESSNVNENIENFPRCPECGVVQTVSMGEHFLTTNKPFEDSLKCSICKYIAPTKCSLQAHERIHDSIAPYVCPECGKDFDDWKLLHAHLEEVCFHLTKQVRLRCPGKKCGKIFAQIITFSAHFITHMQCLNKCTLCNDVFFSDLEFLEHKATHAVNRPPIKIYKCTVCADLNETYTESNFQDHIRGHATNRKQCLYVYICKHCHSYFRSTLTYATHLLRCTKLVPHTNPQLLAKRANFFANDAKRKRRTNFLQIIGNCLTCLTQIKMQVQHFDNAPVNCPNCGDTLNYKNSVKKNNTLILFKAESENDSNTKESSLHKSTTGETTTIKKVSCLLCEDKLTLNEMNDHFALKRCKFHNPVVVIDPKMTYDNSSNNISPKSQESVKKKRRRASGTSLSSKLKKMSTSNSETDLSTEPDEPVPFDGTYRCKLCDYSNIFREQFHSHIVEHRDVSTAYQCMECGECFVVKPSLIKHLLYYHQVVDTESYFKENNCFNKQAVKELENSMRLAPGESKEPVAENQCRVCLKQCNDSLELNKHFRSHGMAFLLKNYK